MQERAALRKDKSEPLARKRSESCSAMLNRVFSVYECSLCHTDAPCLFANHRMRSYRTTPRLARGLPRVQAYCRLSGWHNKRNPTTLRRNGTRGVRTFLVLTTSTQPCRLEIEKSKRARIILESWRVEYNVVRPHSSLGYRTPTNTLKNWRTNLMGAARPQTPRRSPRQAFGGNSSTPQRGEQTA